MKYALNFLLVFNLLTSCHGNNKNDTKKQPVSHVSSVYSGDSLQKIMLPKSLSELSNDLNTYIQKRNENYNNLKGKFFAVKFTINPKSGFVDKVIYSFSERPEDSLIGKNLEPFILSLDKFKTELVEKESINRKLITYFFCINFDQNGVAEISIRK